MTITPGYDAAATRQWLGILHGDSPGLVHICSTGDWTGKLFADLDAATNYVTYLDGERREGIYARVTTIKATLAPGKRGGAADAAALPALWADVDLAGPGHAETDLPPDETAGRAVIAATGLPDPTLWIGSGGGLYPIWLLAQPWTLTAENLDRAKRLAADWQRVIEHAAAAKGWRYGRGVGDLARVLRVPGTVNRKAGLARPCRILSATGTRYTVAQLQAALDAAVAAIAPPPAAPTTPLLPGAPGPVPPARGGDPAGRVGDDFNARADWPAILTPAGWRVHYQQDDVTYWTRPGKTTGISASTNALGTDRLHVFTTSAPPLDGGESYSKFGAYTALHFGGDHKAAARALGGQGYGTPLSDPAAEQQAILRDLLGPPAVQAAAMLTGLLPPPPDPPPTPDPAPADAPARLWAPEVDVSNTAKAADWLRDELGRHRLAGFFARAGVVVHTPREGQDGYQPLGHDDQGDEDGPAQVRPVNDSVLASRISYTYGVYRLTKRGDDYVPTPALFPRPAARTAVDAPDMMPHLRPLRGVVHSPVLRPDGTVLATPGYDPATGLLYLPEPGLTVPEVPARPTGQQVADAVTLLGQMIEGFAFTSKHDRAAVLGLLLTPLIRALAQPPYRLAAITAPQPGSGKTLLATTIRIVHGGVFRAELPGDDDELRKQITTILNYTTGSVVHFDNVTGTLRSSVLAGLLTSVRWDDRKLGANELINARNDRLWILTGNNLTLGGDLNRRTLWVTIDPGMPDPHLRTDFAIKDLERWTRANRPVLIHALLTLAMAWIAAGRPMPAVRGSDSYSHWIQTVSGILATAGIEGTFAAQESARQDIGADDDEWRDFLTAVYAVFEEKPWTVRELLDQVDTGSLITGGPIPLDALPTDLSEKARRRDVGINGIAKSLGRWLRNREGRWAGKLAVRSAGVDRTKTVLWTVRATEVTP